MKLFTIKFFCGSDLRHRCKVMSHCQLGALAKALDEVGGVWGPGDGFQIVIE